MHILLCARCLCSKRAKMACMCSLGRMSSQSLDKDHISSMGDEWSKGGRGHNGGLLMVNT